MTPRPHRDPGRVSDSDSERELHAGDISFHRPHRPDASSTRPRPRTSSPSPADRDADPVTPFAAGSSLEGHVIPVAGGISLDLTRMDAILGVSPADLTATVQPGVSGRRSSARRPSTASSFPARARTRRSAAWPPRTPPAATTVRYGKIARMSSRSRPCSPAVASSAPAARAEELPRPATTCSGFWSAPKGRSA